MIRGYPVGYPGWRIAAKLGVALQVKVFVVYDPEAKCLVGECNDFLPYLGIVTEGKNFEELNRKLSQCFEMALEEAFKESDNSPQVKSTMTLVGALP
ncbi:DUF1902 domain-containing protein [Sutterella wadsworthensis]|jgi:hypothetical protein|uniref:DUF1902 domain-containing protein n=1 Tax=Sutterella wadsworthensis TaxID=40545 RepID=UPI001D068719|nr:DUF1902 domain-containing protein [Sutterella wadsworthensis]MCB7456742.1 DUF1902 domain-containing protein [Sutterella wadsworthensis]